MKTLAFLLLAQFLFLSLALPISQFPQAHGDFLHQFAQWREQQATSSAAFHTVIAWILCFIAAAVSTACGVGGGSLFLPILTVVAGLSLKTATAFNSFMVSAGALSNVIYAICFLDKSLLNYEVTLLSEPCMLLGVSIGVLCNFMFPEWLITVLFALVLTLSTAKTLESGCHLWRAEADRGRDAANGNGADHEDPLLNSVSMEHSHTKMQGKADAADGPFPWKDLLVLLLIWLCFFVLHILLGDKNGKGVIDIKPCGVTYWLVTISQIPIAIGFTLYILYTRGKEHEHANHVNGTNKASVIKNKFESLPKYVFPVAAILTGALSGLFGIGGGLILNPAFLQIGVPPQTAAATSSLMVLFSASMSMVQYILLGMTMIEEAAKYAVLCFVAAVIGLVTMHKVIGNSGRVSLIVFLVSAVMAISTVVITLFGALDVWRQIINGEYMGFKLLC